MPEEGHPEIMKTNAIGRVYTVHPNNAECFYLRMLLHEIRGPTNFTDLRTIDGYICHTYREACQCLGLLENDNHWELTLQEATLTASAEQIRELFAIILTTCNPSNPKQLWDSFKRNMSDDVLYQIRQANPELTMEFNDIFNETLIRLEDKCSAINNQTLATAGPGGGVMGVMTPPGLVPGLSMMANVWERTHRKFEFYRARHRPPPATFHSRSHVCVPSCDTLRSLVDNVLDLTSIGIGSERLNFNIL
ncbi:hypothetical protein EVAR_66011_1 [Eumeta japonica]|uniref:Uncharacterized protein n=1 Tax=Eumeta variegata TaxID=151549 RepID=A0A4C1ZT23_EUMVA|nr:hypothetical protein EVAR_66011_1 [Eumeta japonica]